MAQTPKIMLVEDDINLSEIYQARMAAEGYIVVSAHDGEEALALAAKEKPDLIIADVMMPKISGFEMLDILRNTDGLKHTKVIMLTALGQAEDKTRAQSLGADRYLVKSQVTLEDIVKNARELLFDESTAPTGPTAQPVAPAATAVAPTPPVPASTPVAVPVVSAPAPSVMPAPVTPAIAATPPAVTVTVAPAPALVPTPPVPTPVTAPVAPTIPAAPVGTMAESASQENSEVQNQIANFTQQPTAAPTPTPPPAAVQTTPEPVKPSANAANLTAAVNELLAGTPQATAPLPSQTISPTTSTVSTPAPSVPAAPAPPAASIRNPEPTIISPTPHAEPAGPPPVSTPPAPAAPAPTVAPPSSAPSLEDNAPVAHKKIIKPINHPEVKPDLNTLLAAEEAKNPGAATVPPATATGIPPAASETKQPFTSSVSSHGTKTGIDLSNIAL